MNNDNEALGRYAEFGDQRAFSELVQRRIGLVYSIALRQTGNSDWANDATQAVFVSLARNARKLARKPILIGWFYRSACNAAIDILRAERARVEREKAFQTMHEELGGTETQADWQSIRPLIDQTIFSLNEKDRDAILLRFFDNCSFATIGEQLKLTENAARMRVQRALEKLHGLLSERGIISTTTALAGALGHQANATVPVTVVAAATSAALSVGGGGFLATTLITMKTVKVLLAAGSVAALGTVFFIKHAHTPFKDVIDIPLANRSVNSPQTKSTSTTVAQSEPTISVSPSFSPNNSKLAAGETTTARELANQGKATPHAALETFLWAQEGGDVDVIVSTSYLSSEAITKAHEFFASIKPNERAEHQTAERLVASLLVGAASITGTSRVDTLRVGYRVSHSEPGAQVMPRALGLADDSAMDPMYQTITLNKIWTKDGELKTAQVPYVLYHSEDGWRCVLPPSLIANYFKRVIAREENDMKSRTPRR